MSADGELDEAESFWERQYSGRAAPTELRVSPVLLAFARSLPAGSALDLGCARGDDALWLAARGWAVTAVDVAPSALAVAAARAGDAGAIIDFRQQDLARSFPAGTFDLVSAQYLQSPVAFPRGAVLACGAAAVQPGGHLLVVEHASRPPWSWEKSGAVFPPPRELLDAMAIEPSAWREVFVGRREREARGPDGQVATVADNVVFLRRG